MLVLLFWNGSFLECSVLLGCYFPSDNFHIRKIPAMFLGFKGDSGPLKLTVVSKLHHLVAMHVSAVSAVISELI